MAINYRKYTYKDAKLVSEFISKILETEVIIIGSIGKGLQSTNDIDLYIPGIESSYEIVRFIYDCIKAKGVITTDWGGSYFIDTLFGDIDIFFKGNIDKFDY